MLVTAGIVYYLYCLIKTLNFYILFTSQETCLYSTNISTSSLRIHWWSDVTTDTNWRRTGLGSSWPTSWELLAKVLRAPSQHLRSSWSSSWELLAKVLRAPSQHLGSSWSSSWELLLIVLGAPGQHLGTSWPTSWFWACFVHWMFIASLIFLLNQLELLIILIHSIHIFPSMHPH